MLNCKGERFSNNYRGTAALLTLTLVQQVMQEIFNIRHRCADQDWKTDAMQEIGEPITIGIGAIIHALWANEPINTGNQEAD